VLKHVVRPQAVVSKGACPFLHGKGEKELREPEEDDKIKLLLRGHSLPSSEGKA
jgi:hypothetical protein